MVKIAVLASFNMDLVMRAPRRPNAGETMQGDFAMHPGGKGFNQAIAARRLGAEVIVAGRVGDDEFGRMFLGALDGEGIDPRAVEIDPIAGTGVASIIVEPDGSNTIVQAPRANRHVSVAAAADVAAQLSDGGVAMMQLENSDESAVAFASAARAAGAVTMLNAAPASNVAAGLLACTDVLVVNEIEAAAVLGISGVHDAAAMAADLQRRGPRLVAVTTGECGVVAADTDGRHAVATFDVDVVDTTGAGDAFCAGLAVRLAEGAGLGHALRFANAAGALACTREGAAPSMPDRAAVEELLRSGATRSGATRA